MMLFFRFFFWNSLRHSFPQAGEGKPSNVIWSGGLPDFYTKVDVERIFDDFGAISNIHLSQTSPKYAIVEFKKK